MNKGNTAEVNTFEEGKEQISTKESNGHDSTIRILRWTGLLNFPMEIFPFVVKWGLLYQVGNFLYISESSVIPVLSVLLALCYVAIASAFYAEIF